MADCFCTQFINEAMESKRYRLPEANSAELRCDTRTGAAELGIFGKTL
jgi:hypothetical protein